jgi:O-antigen ligase
MSTVAAPPAASRAGGPAFVLSCALLAALPLVMWVANRSAPLVLTLAALAMLAETARTGRLAALAGRIGAALRSPAGLAGSAFLAWALLSVAWSHRFGPGLAMWGELALSIAAGFVLALAWPGRAPVWAWRALGLALVAAGLLTIFEMSVGLGHRALIGQNTYSFALNRPTLTCLLLAVPAAHALWRGTLGDRLLAGLILLAVAAAVLSSESGASKLGLLVLALAWPAARLLPRLALGLLAAGMAAAILIAPWQGQLSDTALPGAVHEELADSHSRDRVDIWLSFGEAIRARPLAGSGFGSSAALGSHPVAREVSPERRLLLDVGHPHAVTVQLWSDTGFVGAVLALAAMLAGLAGLRHLPASELAPRLALVAAAFAVASIGHGAWQGWWWAALGAAAVWFAAGAPAFEAGDRS